MPLTFGNKSKGHDALLFILSACLALRQGKAGGYNEEHRRGRRTTPPAAPSCTHHLGLHFWPCKFWDSSLTYFSWHRKANCWVFHPLPSWFLIRPLSSPEVVPKCGHAPRPFLLWSCEPTRLLFCSIRWQLGSAEANALDVQVANCLEEHRHSPVFLLWLPYAATNKRCLVLEASISRLQIHISFRLTIVQLRANLDQRMRSCDLHPLRGDFWDPGF